ncbi:ROK family protein [Micropruina sp.]|uniref:ROK family protein n=1 Tax=Micropruina sp. TaxID=2737536 RepID=UPI0039E52334
MASSQARHWRTAAQALAMVRRRQQVTRTELADMVGLRSGPTSDLVKRLVQAELISERSAEQAGPGRPTTTLHASPTGPVALVLDIRHGDWRLGASDLDGSVTIHEVGGHDGIAPDQLLDMLAQRLRRLAAGYGDRVVGAGITVPGLAVDGRLSMPMLGWQDIETTPLTSALDRPMVLGNDATMAAVAEARMHPAELNSLLHIVVEVGVGGALIADGRPTPSAHGLHGEFGHLPFGDPALRCPCGAKGCWTAAFDLAEVARRTGVDATADPRSWLQKLYSHPDDSDAIRHAMTSLAADLGRGIAGLINALDPALVTLGGLADLVRFASVGAFYDALNGGLMSAHRARPPQIVQAIAGDDATLVGMGLSVFDHVLDAELLARWASRGAGVA